MTKKKFNVRVFATLTMPINKTIERDYEIEGDAFEPKKHIIDDAMLRWANEYINRDVRICTYRTIRDARAHLKGIKISAKLM